MSYVSEDGGTGDNQKLGVIDVVMRGQAGASTEGQGKEDAGSNGN